MDNSIVELAKGSAHPENDQLSPRQSIEDILEALQKLQTFSDRKYIITSYTATDTAETSRR